MFYRNIISSALILLVIFSFPGSSLAERVVVGYGYTKTIEAIVINSSVADSSGNLYFAGNFEGTDIDFDPSGGIDLHTDSGGETNFLTKINVDGSYGYTKVLGELSNTLKLAIDSSGNLYILGYFAGTDIDFDSSGGTDLHTSVGGTDAFLTKINSDGSYGYTKTFGGASIYFSPYSLVFDSLGNIFLAGVFSDLPGSTADFDPSVGTDVHTLVGDSDAFLTKINSDGSYGYTKTFGGALAYLHTGMVAVDSSDNLFLAGSFSGTDADFDPSVGTDLRTPIGQEDAFLTKINSDGSYGYTLIFGGDFGDGIASIVIDSSDAIYLAGNTTGTEFDLDPTGGSFLYVPNGGAIFIIKINNDGTFGYAKTIDDSFGDSRDDEGIDMVIDSSDNLYLTGTFESDSTDFDPSGGVDTNLNAGGADIFVTKINVDGSYIYTHTIGGDDDDNSFSVSTNAPGDVYISGYFAGTDIDFNPLGGTDLYTSVGGAGFITKISQTTYHHITSLPGTLTAEVSSTEDSVDDSGVDDGILKDDEENIRILHSTVPLADMDTTFSADLAGLQSQENLMQ